MFIIFDFNFTYLYQTEQIKTFKKLTRNHEKKNNKPVLDQERKKLVYTTGNNTHVREIN
jgi:hypothetical protein